VPLLALGRDMSLICLRASKLSHVFLVAGAVQRVLLVVARWLRLCQMRLLFLACGATSCGVIVVLDNVDIDETGLDVGPALLDKLEALCGSFHRVQLGWVLVVLVCLVLV